MQGPEHRCGMECPRPRKLRKRSNAGPRHDCGAVAKSVLEMTAAAVVRDGRNDRQGMRQRNHFEGAWLESVVCTSLLAMTADNLGAEVLEAVMLNNGLIPALTLMTHCSSYPRSQYRASSPFLRATMPP